MSSGNGTDSPQDEQLATLTHARLRIAQGDIQGGRALLLEILDRGEEVPEAERLLRSIEGRPDRARTVEPERPLPPTQPADAADLGADFRSFLSESDRGRRATIDRLREWLRRMRGGGEQGR
jgi:hypothetical protein